MEVGRFIPGVMCHQDDWKKIEGEQLFQTEARSCLIWHVIRVYTIYFCRGVRFYFFFFGVDLLITKIEYSPI